MIVQMLSTATPAPLPIGSRAIETDSRLIIAPETSELAQRLRSSGWIARAGWLNHAPSGRIWLVRFESPSDHVPND